MKSIDDLFLLDDKNRYRPIEGLRAMAILMVFSSHFLNSFGQKAYFLRTNSLGLFLAKCLHAGHIGVDVFFVVSGFLIYRLLFIYKISPVIFLKRRVQRLFPTHVLVMLVLAYAAFDLPSFISNVFFLPAFIRSLHSYNNVTWTLGWEWLFYFALLAISLISRYRSKTAFLMMGGFVIGNLLLQHYFTDTQVLLPDAFRFSGFFLGCAVGAALKNRTSPSNTVLLSSLSIASLLGLFACTAIWSVHGEEIFRSVFFRSAFYLMVGGFSALLLYSLLAGDSFASKFFSLKCFRLIGQISYSFYLIHLFIGIPFSRRITGQVSDAAGMIGSYFISLFMTFLMSVLLFYYTERNYFLKRKTALARTNTAMSPGIEGAFPRVGP